MLLKTVFVQAVGGASDPQLAVSAPGDMRRLPSVASGGDGSSATGDGFDGMTATPMTASRDQLEAEAAAALLDMCKGTSNVHTSK